MKEFNVTGTCLPGKHYMVDTSEKIAQIIQMIEKGKYFTINRARQYGKTTTIASLFRQLKAQYVVIRMSFEGVGEETFSSNQAFVRFFIQKAGDFLSLLGEEDSLIQKWQENIDDIENRDAFNFLSKKISALCRSSQKEIILMIDEVDKSSDNQIFLNFLGMLRNKYLDSLEEIDATFKSVILAGVYDIKNLKLKLRPDSEKKYNSPWNIASDFNVDMSFSAREISTMLDAYKKENQIEMDIEEISQQIYFYTKGYPYLVSRICKWIDEEGNREWTAEAVQKAEKELLHTPCTLFDDLIKNYENNQDLRQMIDLILFSGKEYIYVFTDPVIQLGMMFGIFAREKEHVVISNVIFETLLYNHVMSRKDREGVMRVFEKSQFINDGKLNLQLVLEKFQDLMKAEYREEDEKFLEQNGRLLFLCFLKPIINGTGFYFVEPETRNSNRMDVVVVYGTEEFIIELKIWHGWKYRERGIRQLEEYMENRNQKKGYLVSFSFVKKKDYKREWISAEETSKEIFEVVI